MKIEHEYNAEIKGALQYFDGNGKMVATYPMIEFKLWVDKSYSFEIDSREQVKFIDDNWISLTTKFYEFKNTEYKYPFGGQGIYNVSNN